MIALIEKVEKNKFLEKMSGKAYEFYKSSWQRKLQSDAYMKGVNDALNELKIKKQSYENSDARINGKF